MDIARGVGLSKIKFIFHRSMVLVILCIAFLLETIHTDNQIINSFLGILGLHLYTIVFTIWGFSISQRIIQKNMVRYFRRIAAMLVMWVSIQGVKDFVVVNKPDLSRFLCYMMYIPMIFIPFLGVCTAVCIGKPEEKSNVKLEWIGHFIALILIGIVLTNDLHHLMFIPKNDSVNLEQDFSYGICFGLVVLWIAWGLITMIATAYYRSKAYGKEIIVAIIIVIMFIMILFYVTYVVWFRGSNSNVFTGVSCIFISSVCELCIDGGLLPSNTHYGQLLKKATTLVKITDNNYRIMFSSEYDEDIDIEILKKVQKEGAFEYKEGKRLNELAIMGGHMFWVDDVSMVTNMRNELKSMLDTIYEEHDLLQLEVELKRREAKIETRNEIYDKIIHQIPEKITKLSELLHKYSCDIKEENNRIEIDKKQSDKKESYVKENEELSNKEILKRVCIIGAYIKRRCNLLLIESTQERISLTELSNCVRETMENMRIQDIDCMLNSCSEDEVRIQDIMNLYDGFESIIEGLLDSIDSMLVNIKKTDKTIDLKLQFECRDVLKCREIIQNIVIDDNIKITLDEDGNDLYVVISTN